MSKRNTAAHIRAAILASAVATLSAPALAQDSSNAPVEIDEIVVTGSHIKRDNFNYSTPIKVIGSEEISATGSTNLGDLLQTLPQSVSTINNANTAFSTTFSGLNLTDLRFLGPARTLVLVNGRRFVSGTPPGGGYGVDLNAIPTGMIERIEVLTGGASAIYGSDAIAGVVNVVTRTDFEGLEIYGQAGGATEGDKQKQDITLTVGGKFGNGGFAVASVGWSTEDALRSRERSFSDTDLGAYDLDGDGFAETDAWLGSSFPPAGRLNPAGPADFLGDGNVFLGGSGDEVSYLVTLPMTADWYLWGRFYYPGDAPDDANAFMVRFDGTGLTRLTHNGFEEGTPAWGP